MINCFVIAEEGNLTALSACLQKMPLAKLVGWYKGLPPKYSELMDLSTQVVFVDYDLSVRFKSLMQQLSQHVSIVYLSEDTTLAYQAFEDGVLDFIVGPFDLNRITKCINKLVRISLSMPVERAQRKQVANIDSFFVKPDPKGKLELLVNCNDVLFIEAYQNDVAIQLVNGKRFVCYHTMKEMEDSLSNCFMRVHKSFIINYKKMTAFDGSNIIIETSQKFSIPLGGVYKKAFLEKRNTMVIRKPMKVLEGAFFKQALSSILMFMISETVLVNEWLSI